MVCAFLPQTGLLLPFAAFFVPALLWLLFGKNSRGYGVCLLLGAMASACCSRLIPGKSWTVSTPLTLIGK